MENWEREKLEHYGLHRVDYKGIKEKIEDVVKIQIGTIYLDKIRNRLDYDIPLYYFIFKENLREAAKGVADMLKSEGWLEHHLKNLGVNESTLMYIIYALYILEK